MWDALEFFYCESWKIGRSLKINNFPQQKTYHIGYHVFRTQEASKRMTSQPVNHTIPGLHVAGRKSIRSELRHMWRSPHHRPLLRSALSSPIMSCGKPNAISFHLRYLMILRTPNTHLTFVSHMIRSLLCNTIASISRCLLWFRHAFAMAPWLSLPKKRAEPLSGCCPPSNPLRPGPPHVVTWGWFMYTTGDDLGLIGCTT